MRTRLVSVINSISFRAKVALLLSGVVLILGVVAILQARGEMRRILGGELERRGEAIAKDLAASVTDPLITGDLLGVHERVNLVKINNPDVRYVLVFDASDTLQSHTFGTGVPKGLVEANVLPARTPVQVRHLQTEEGIVRDVAAPVFEGKAGAVRVGMTERWVEAAVSHNSRNLIVFVAAASLLGLLLSYLLSYYLTHPLRQVLSGVQSVARGDLSRRIRSPARDEAGQLGHAFNIMAQELENKELAQRKLIEKVISSQEEERKRVARELHDELAQQLTSVLLSLEAVDNALAPDDQRRRQVIERAKRVAQSSLAETRKLIADLRPTVLDDLGLVPSIRSYAESHLGPIGTQVVFKAKDVPESLPQVVETAAFRIVQEAINNIAKHARAKRAGIDLHALNGRLLGEIKDDGVGFSRSGAGVPQTASGIAVGIRGMEERAAILGGELLVESHPGRGTRVSFSIPLAGGMGHD